MPFKIDPSCDSGSNAAAVEGFKSISLGHDTYFLTFTAGAKQMVAGSASTDAKEQLASGQIKSKCYLLRKGGEGRMKNYLQYVDILRSDKDKNGPIALGFPLNKPGKDAATVQGLLSRLDVEERAQERIGAAAERLSDGAGGEVVGRDRAGGAPTILARGWVLTSTLSLTSCSRV